MTTTVKERLQSGIDATQEGLMRRISPGDLIEGRIAAARTVSGLASAAMQVHPDSDGDPVVANLKSVADSAGTTSLGVILVALFTATVNVAADGVYTLRARVLEDDGTISEYDASFTRGAGETTTDIRDELVTDGQANFPSELTVAAGGGDTLTVTGDSGVVFEVIVESEPNPSDLTVATTSPSSSQVMMGSNSDGIPRLLFNSAVTSYAVTETTVPNDLIDVLAAEL